jgi:hypothetical protein
MSTGTCFWPDIADPIAQCALGHCPAAESNNFPTTPVAFFKLFPAILTKVQHNTSQSLFCWALSHNILLTSKKRTNIPLILNSGIPAFFSLRV